MTDPLDDYAGHVDPRLKPIPDAELRRLVNDFRRRFNEADSSADALEIAYEFHAAIGECEEGA